MSKEPELMLISAEHVPRAIKKAEHYRLLNQPVEAESICLDVLAVDPDNQEALVIIVLTITDQFAEGKVATRKAREYLHKIVDEYKKHYYAGLIAEREGRSYLRRGLPGGFAYECFHDAIVWYGKAEALTTDHNDDSILRHNCCLRMIRNHDLEARHSDSELPLE